jgi:PAS domain-containing protein
MNNAEFQLQGLADPRLAVHATSALPAWLWSTDGTRILWANPVGVRVFGAANSAALATRIFGPANSHRRQVARLAARLRSNGAIRLERLRGFGAAPGMLATCGCSRFDFPDGSHGTLVVAGNASGRTMPLVERLQRLVEGVDRPIAAFARDGMFVGASDAARPLLGFRNLIEGGLDQARSDALKQGRVETPVGIGHMVLQRVGSGADIGLIALLAPVLPEAAPEPAEAQAAAVADQPAQDCQQPASTRQAPAEFTLIDEFDDPPATPAVEAVAADAPSEAELWNVLQADLPHAEDAHRQALQPQASDAETPDVESSVTAASDVVTTPEIEIHPREPSPYVEAVADEPTAAPAEQPPPAVEKFVAPAA